MSQRSLRRRHVWPMLVLALLGPPVVPAGLCAQEEVLLELLGTAGEWLRYVHRNDLVVELPDDLGGPAVTRTSIRLLHRVVDASPESIDYLTTLEEVTLEVQPPPPELPDLRGMQGLAFSHTSDRSGRTLGLRLPGQDVEAGPGLMEQVENWLGQLGFPLLPDRAVSVGEAWTETVRVPAMALGLVVDYDVVQTRSVRLKEIRSTRRSRVAFLEVVTSWEPAPEPGGAGGGVVSLRGTAEQIVRFDIPGGRFLGSTGSSDLEIVLTPAGAAQYVAVRAQGRQLTGLSASSDD
ncbi:MAG: hypothetical protein M8866_07775 [marine benthic group bacterium]|nr:hypothetical protein [Candidatus Benthicola marisminoris]